MRSVSMVTSLAPILALMAGCTNSPPPVDQQAQGDVRQCFLPQQVTNFHAADARTVYVTVGTRRIYRTEIVGTCPDINFTPRVGIAASSGSWICRGHDAELIVPSPTGTQRCLVTHVEQLTPEQAQAYLASRRGR